MTRTASTIKLETTTILTQGGNATEEVIRKYVQDQLVELDRKEINSDQLDLF